MTSHSVTRLEQGGITIDAAKNSVPLVAASYSHPTLGDRTIVRLIPEALVEAEDLALGVTGLEPGSRINVGHTRRRAIGFPAWPILNDPANAHHALNLVADLERGGRVAHTKPKRFKEIITELATKLDNSAPHFLPTFLEEAGRIFITVENPVFASQMFTLAREAEQRHRLPIDENRHLEAVLEFAYAGALSTKELSKEAKRLGDAMEPAEAYRTYRALCVERVRGGLLPHAGMKKELTQLATAAGLDPAHEDVTIATEMLRAFSIQRAGAHFWKNYEKAICQAAADNAAVNDRLLELAPRGLETDQWLALLHKTGAIDLVRAGKHPEFIPHILLFEAHWRKWPHKASTQLAPVLAELLPHAGLSQVPLPYDRLHYLPADVIEVIVASGIPFAFSEPFKATSVNLTEWARQLERAPLPHTAAEKSLRKELVNGIMDSLKHPEVVDTLALDPHIRPLVVELITAHVERLESGVPPVDTLERTTKFARGFELVRDPEIQALLDRIRSIHRDPAAPIAETFRRGVPDELGWPELEQVQQAYGQNKKLHLGQGASDCWPGAIVNQKSVSTYLRGTTATEVSNWTGERLYGAMEADGQFGLATYTDSDPRVWWADTPKGTPSSLKEFWGWGLNASVPVPGGRMFGEGVIMRPGESTWARGSEHFFVDGERIWLATETKVVEIDPATGATGRESLPHWFEEQRRRHPDVVFDPSRSQHRPVTDVTAESPYSTAEGYHRHAVFTRPDDPYYCLLVDADGTEYTVTGEWADAVHGTLRRPDGGTWIFASSHLDTAVLEPEDLTPVTIHGTDMRFFMWWHHTRVREPEVSARLRSITADDVRPLVDHALAEQSEEVSDELCAAVGDVLGVTDPVLRYGLACVVHTAVKLWPQTKTQTRAEELTTAPTFVEHHELLNSAMGHHTYEFDAMDIWQGAAELGLHDRYVPAEQYTHRRFGGSNDWMKLLGHGDALLALAATPGRTADEVQALKELWMVLRDAGALGATNLVKETFERWQFPLHSEIGLPPRAAKIRVVGNQDTVIVRDADSQPVTDKGEPRPSKECVEIPATRTDLEPVFDALIARIGAESPLPWSPKPGEAFAAATGAPLAEAHLVMAGFPNFQTSEVNFLPKELRTAMGLKVDEAKLAREQLQLFGDEFLGVLAAGVPADASTLLIDGLDATSMAQFWSHNGPTYYPPLPAHLAAQKPKTLPEQLVQRVLTAAHVDEEDRDGVNNGWAEEVTALLWAASEMDLADPLRPVLADYAEQLHNEPRSIDDIEVTVGSSSKGELRRVLGVPEWVSGSNNEPDFQAGRFTLRQEHSNDWVHVDLSGVTDPADPDLALAQTWAKERLYPNNRMLVQAAAYRARGALLAFAEWLRQPGDGLPRDPLASAPGLVAEAAAELGVSEDAARYYLQLLAWPDPTDANVRRWNNWKKADITRAGGELVDADVAVSGKRARSGRGFFLKGGWIDVPSAELPIELWKLDAFAIDQTGYRGVYESQLGTPVAPEPPPQWFATCWERAQGDGAPRFAELETTRRRRR